MPRDDAGQLERVGQGLPTIYHEDLINKYCENWGFIKYGFSKFMKMIFLNEYSRSPKIPAQIYSTLQDKPSQNAINKSLLRHYKTVINGIPDDIDGGNEYFGCDWFGYHSPDNFCLEYDSRFKMVPDCWRYNGHSIDIIEVCDSSVTHFKKLEKLALLHDMLFQTYGEQLNIRVFEYFIRTGTMVEHDLYLLFDLWESHGTGMTTKEEKERSRMYQIEMAGKDISNINFQIERLN